MALIMSYVKVWNNNNLESKSNDRFFPTDMMLRALFSNSYFDLKNIKQEGYLLDIGCLYANNMILFSNRGWKLFGTEVTDESVEIAKSCCELQKINAEVKLDSNTELPFDSEKFDIYFCVFIHNIVAVKLPILIYDT